MAQHYSDPKREALETALPDVETFVVDTRTPMDECPTCQALTDNGEPGMAKTEHRAGEHTGWFYWFCFPGCLPDSEAQGPFTSESEALADARDGVDTDEEEG